eukprot:SAG25_NODE_3908_length_932_cov_1.111645_2_plen_65_part_01
MAAAALRTGPSGGRWRLTRARSRCLRAFSMAREAADCGGGAARGADPLATGVGPDRRVKKLGSGA